MNFFTAAHREDRKLCTLKKEWRDQNATSIDDNIPDSVTEKFERQLDEEFERVYRRAVRRMLIAREINIELGLTQAPTNRHFFITIRPDCRKITFTDFYALIHKLVNRACFKNYWLSFEQKGDSDATLGHGFHVHMIAVMSQKGKAEVVRDIHNSVKHCTEKHCIQVDITYNGEQMFNNYCIEYDSKDGHKINTKEWDSKWRTNLGLADFYKNDMPRVLDTCVPAIKSDAGTLIIDLN